MPTNHKSVQINSKHLAPQKLRAQPGQALNLVIDGEPSIGKKQINGEAVKRVRQGKALQVAIDEQAQAASVIEDFYAAPAADVKAQALSADDTLALLQEDSAVQVAAAPAAEPILSQWDTPVAQPTSAIPVGLPTATTGATVATAAVAIAESAGLGAGTLMLGALGPVAIIGGSSRSKDTTAPSVTVADNVAGTAHGAVTYTITFSEAVTGFSAGKVITSAGTLSGFTANADGKTYTIVLTPPDNASGSAQLSISVTGVTDAAGNQALAPGVAAQAYDTVPPDTTAPSVTVADNVAGTAHGAVTYTITFSEAVTGFSAGKVITSAGTLSGFTANADGKTYTIVLTPPDNASGSAQLSISVTGVTDAAGNQALAPGVAAQAYDTVPPDTTAPSVTVADNVAGTAHGAVTYTITFSEAVTGFSAGKVSTSAGTLSGFTANADGKTYTIVLTPPDNAIGSAQLSISVTGVTDAAGNQALAPGVAAQAYDTVPPDTTAPSVTVADNVAGTAHGAVTYTITFSEAVTGFSAGKVSTSAGTLSGFTANADGKTYTIVLTPPDNAIGSAQLSISVTGVTDAAGNQALAPGVAAQAYDTVPPDTTAPSVTVADNVAGTAHGAVTYTITFSEAVTGFSAGKVSTSAGTLSGFTANADGKTYTIVLTPPDNAIGSAQLSISVTGVTDAAGNQALAPGVAAQAYDTVPPDTTAPSVTVADNVAGTAHGAVTYTITFSEAVTGFSAGKVITSAGTLSGFTANADGKTYTIVLTPPDNASGSAQLSISVTGVTDAAGNQALAPGVAVQAYDTVPPDTTAPTAGAGMVFTRVSEDSDDSAANATTNQATGTVVFTYTGTDLAEGESFQYSTNGTSWQNVSSVNAGNNTVTINALDLTGSPTVQIRAIDAAGNTTNALASQVITYDNAAPSVTTKTSGPIAPTDDLSLTFDDAGLVKGTGNIAIYTLTNVLVETIDVTTNAVSISNGVVTINPTANLISGTHYYVTVDAGAFADAAGNPTAAITGNTAWTFMAAVLSTTVTVGGATGAVSASELATMTLGGTLANLVNATGVTITSIVFTPDTGAPFTLQSSLPTLTGDANNSTWTLANDNAWTSQLVDGKTYDVTVNLSGNNVGSPVTGEGSTSVPFVVDTGIPSITIDATLEGDNQVNAAEDNDVVVSGTITGVEDGRTVTVTLSDGTTTITKTATVSSNGWALSGLELADISALNNGNITVKANVSDAAGNPAVEASKTLTLDNGIPSITIDATLEGDNQVNAAEDNDVVVSGTITGVEDGRTVTVTLSDGTTTITKTATVSSNGWALSGLELADISALNNGNITVKANVSDAAGNPAVEASKTLTLDNGIPSITIDATLEGDNQVNAAEDNDVVVSGTTTGVEDGRTVTVTLSDGTTTITKTATVSSNGWALSGPELADISALNNGNITVKANVSDAAGNPAVEASKTLTLDNGIPSITIDATLEGDNQVNAAEDNDVVVSGTITGVEDGRTVTVTLSDGTTTITKTATVSSNGWALSGLELADISALNNGNITVKANVSDAAGNPAVEASKTLTLDNGIPSITIDATLEGDNQVNAAEDNDVVVSGATTGVEDGRTVTVTLSDGTTTITKTATVSSNGWALSGLELADISALNNGNITVKANVSDAAGNPAVEASKTLTLDNDSPSITIDATLEGDNQVNAAEDNDVVVSGTITGVEDGRTVTVTLSDGTTTITKTATVSSNGWALSGLELADISALNNGNITVKANVSDAAGNPAVEASKTLTLDNDSPSITIDATLEGDNQVNAAEDNDVVVSGTTTGVEDGRTVTVTLSDGTTTITKTATVSSNGWALSGLDLADISALNNGNITVKANVSDAAGNPAAEASKTLTLDNDSPSITIATTLEGDNQVNAAEDNDVVVSGTTTGVEDGRTVTVTLSDGTTTITKTATVSSNGWALSGLDLADISALNNGNITVKANVSDAAGNPAVEASKTLTLDNDSPSITIDATLEGDNQVNAAEDNDVVVSGTTTGVEDGRTVTVTLSDGTTTITKTATVSSNGWALSGLELADISALNNGNITVKANVSDAAGNPAVEASKTLTLDNGIPSITIDATLEGDNQVNAAEDNDVVVSGTITGVEDGRTVTVTLSDGTTTITKTATVSSNGWALSGLELADISALNNGNITVKANVSDAAGNPAVEASKTLTLDNGIPSITIDATLEGDNQVNAAEDNDVVVSGATTGVEDGRTVTVTLSDGTTTITKSATVSSNGWALSGLELADISALNNGNITVKANVSDAAGNPAVEASKTLTLDNGIPSITIDATLEGDNQVNAAEDNDVVVSGTITGVEDGRTVTVTLSDGTTTITKTATVSSNGWALSGLELADISALNNGNITVKANVSDAAGNPAVEASKTLTLDNGIPSITIDATLEGDNQVNAAEDNDVVVSGATTGVEDGRTVTVTLSDGTTTITKTATVSSNGWALSGLELADISALNNGNITVKANVSDAAGNPAVEASKTLTLDNGIPSITIDATLEGDNQVNAAEDNDVVVSGTITGVEDGRTVTVTLSDGTTTITKTATVSSNGWALSGPELADISALNNGNITVKANVSDAAGNPAVEASKTLTLDNGIPSITIDATLEGDNQVNAAEDNDVVVSGTITGVEDGRTVTVTLSDGTTTITKTATVSSNGWALSGLELADISALNNGNITVKANVSDAAGNPAVEASKTLTLDNGIPSITIDATLEGDNQVNATEDNDVVVSGTITGVEDGRTVTVTLSDGTTTITKTATVSSNGWALSGLELADISALNNGNITVKANVSDAAGNPAVEASKTLTLDNGIPSVTTKTSGPIAPADDLSLTFDDAGLVKGTGNIAIYTLANGLVETIDVTTNAVSISNGVVTINPTANLISGTHYYVTVDAGAFADAAGNPTAAITGNTAWTFRAAVLSTTVTVGGATGAVSASELATMTLGGTLTNRANATGVIITSIVFTPTDGSTSVTLSNGLPTLSGDVTNSTWTLANDNAWTSQLVDGKTYDVTVNLSGTSGSSPVTGEGSVQAITIDKTNPVLTLGNLADTQLTSAQAAAYSQSYSATDTLTGVASTVAVVKSGGAVQSGVTLTTNSGHVAGNLSSLADGDYTIEVTSTDNAGNTHVQNQAITIDKTNPVLTLGNLADTQLTSAQAAAYSQSYTATDALTGVASTVAVVKSGGTVQGGVTLTTTGGHVAGNLSSLADGDYTIEVTSTDNAGNTHVQNQAITIDKQAPIFSSATTATFTENATSTAYDAQTSEGDTGMSYSLSGTDFSQFNIDSASGAVTFKNAPNFERPTDAGADNVYNFTVTATDQAGNSTARAVALTVSADNFTPAQLMTLWQSDGSGGSGTATTTGELQARSREMMEQRANVSADGTASGSNALSQYINRVTGTDVVSDAEFDAGFTITGKAAVNASNIKFWLDNNRENGTDEIGTALFSGQNGVTINYDSATGDYTIGFAANSTALRQATHGTAGSGVHKLTVDTNGNGTLDSGEASRLFLVASGTAQSTDTSTSAQNYSVYDIPTGNVFVYYYGDPDGQDGVGVWTQLDGGSTVDRDSDPLGWGDWDYYNTPGITENITTTSGNTALGLTTVIGAQVWEFQIGKAITGTAYTFTASLNRAGDHTLQNSNTSRLPALDEMLALYAANFSTATVPGALQPISDTTSYFYDYVPNEDNRPSGWGYRVWTATPMPSGYAYFTLYGYVNDPQPGDPSYFVSAVL